MDLQEVSEVAPEIHPPEHTTMTVDEFLARDIEGYENRHSSVYAYRHT